MHRNKYILLYSLIFFSTSIFAQNGSSSSNVVLYSIMAIAAVLGVGALLTLGDNLLHIEGKKAGVNTSKSTFGLYPSLSNLFQSNAPSFAKDGTFHKLNKGYNIKLNGDAEGNITDLPTTRIAIKPTNFNGMSPIPKIVPEIGSSILAGDVLFYDKKHPEIMYVSPVSGELLEVVRGDKRAITEVIVLADKEQKFKQFNPPSLNASREDIVSFLLQSGAWAYFNQRPYDIIPGINDIPNDIFITTFDTAPLAPDNAKIVKGKHSEFQKGLDVLAVLTTGKVHLGLDGNHKPADEFINATGVEKHYFAGKHPAGNVGVQIHHVSPIKAGKKVWTLTVQEVIALGNLFLNGKIDGTRVVALVGSEFKQPTYVRTFQGASISDLVNGRLEEGEIRLVSGDVLSGKQVSKDGFLNFRDDQLTSISEGNYYELFGWLLPIAPRPSVSGTFPNALFPNHKFIADTNTHGEKRAFVVTGQYEDLIPMDIYPQHLMKAIITNDIEKMEGLGIYELTEEDVALAEFACTSKMPLQSILREGLVLAKSQE